MAQTYEFNGQFFVFSRAPQTGLITKPLLAFGGYDPLTMLVADALASYIDLYAFQTGAEPADLISEKLPVPNRPDGDFFIPLRHPMLHASNYGILEQRDQLVPLVTCDGFIGAVEFLEALSSSDEEQETTKPRPR